MTFYEIVVVCSKIIVHLEFAVGDYYKRDVFLSEREKYAPSLEDSGLHKTAEAVKQSCFPHIFQTLFREAGADRATALIIKAGNPEYAFCALRHVELAGRNRFKLVTMLAGSNTAWRIREAINLSYLGSTRLSRKNYDALVAALVRTKNPTCILDCLFYASLSRKNQNILVGALIGTGSVADIRRAAAANSYELSARNRRILSSALSRLEKQ